MSQLLRALSSPFLFVLTLLFTGQVISAQAAVNTDQFIIVMAEQLRPVAISNTLKSKEAKGRYVYRALSESARRSQAGVKQYLERRQIRHRPYTVVNAIYAELTPEQLAEVNRLPGVATVTPNPWTKAELGYPLINTARARQTVEWGVDRIGAPFLWAEGFRGEGAVVGGQDTGYDWQHPAIIRQYRGVGITDTIHDYNWHDAIRTISPLNSSDNNPCGLGVSEPCDDNNHGTHTMGTMVGDDGNGNQIGVAPAARWVACRNMERGWGSPASYIECFEWFLAPTKIDGTDPDPTKAPHVIANSWSCPEVEGCFPDNFALMETAVNNLRAAGVVVVTSAGNSGSQGCGSVSTPPSIFASSFAVGATNSQDSIAGFSSRGTVTVDGSNRLKPQVVAPGVGVRSAIRGERYASFSGTSMAGPHVAGAVALLISAVPDLAGNVDGIERILMESALPLYSDEDCGDFPGNQRPNAVYGYGRIDLEQALILARNLVNTEEAEAASPVSIFPNPAGESVWIQMAAEVKVEEVALRNAVGQRLTPNIQPEGGGRIRVNLAGLPSGVYWLELSNAGGKQLHKIIKR